MSTGIWSAVSGAVAQTTSLDVAANNVANAATAGYRGDRVVFRQELNHALDRSMGTSSLRYSLVRTVEPDRAQGGLVQTGRPLDVALRSPDQWFTVATQEGPRYTRVGQIQLTSEGMLATPDGRVYLDASGNPISVPTDARTLEIAADGGVIVDGEENGMRLGVVEFQRSARLEKEGSTLVRAAPGERGPVPVDADLAVGAFESSNTSPMAGMTALVQASREFEMIAKVIEVFAGLEHRTALELAKK